MVFAVIDFDHRMIPIETLRGGEIDLVSDDIGLALLLIPLVGRHFRPPNALYVATIK